MEAPSRFTLCLTCHELLPTFTSYLKQGVVHRSYRSAGSAKNRAPLPALRSSNAIAPGFFIAKQNRDVLLNADGSYTQRAQTIVDLTPMGRFGESAELQGPVLWLCSDAASFVTGTVIPVDGGFSAFSGL